MLRNERGFRRWHQAASSMPDPAGEEVADLLSPESSLPSYSHSSLPPTSIQSWWVEGEMGINQGRPWGVSLQQ